MPSGPGLAWPIGHCLAEAAGPGGATAHGAKAVGDPPRAAAAPLEGDPSQSAGGDGSGGGGLNAAEFVLDTSQAGGVEGTRTGTATGEGIG